MSDESDIRGDWKARAIGKAIGWAIRLFGFTYRAEVIDKAGVASGEISTPVVFLHWHNRIFTSPPLWKRSCGGKRPLVALTSASKDGAILEAAISVVGAEAARGSSSRRGAAALVTLRKALRQGKDTCVTPDGPRGPLYKLQPGGIKLAQAAEVPIVIQQIITRDFWEIGSWDKLRIPKPFSSVTLMYDGPIHVPKDLNEEEFEAFRLALEQRMNQYNEPQSNYEHAN